MMLDKIRWEADAGNITSFENFDSFVYLNGSVNAFLYDDNKSFVIAAKGVGKTLLLSYKRYLLEKRYDNNSMIFIPDSHPYISFVESIKAKLSFEHKHSLQSWEFCERLWALVIELCIISYSNMDKNEIIDQLPDRANRFKKLIQVFISKPNSIEYIFNEILSLNSSSFIRIVIDVSNIISDRFRRIKQGMVLFFDRFDNALETSHDDIWIPIQAGLMEAAWNVMRSNHHIKIYLSIRQEAYAAYRSHNRNAIYTSITKIEYSKTELEELVNHLISYYEGCKDMESFLGFNSFPNTVIYREEKVFDFMYRYSIGRPRDFVQFCGELSLKKCNYDNYDIERKRVELKEAIRKVSSETIIRSLFDEIKMLLECLKTLDSFNRFLTLINHNVLLYDELKQICKNYNGNMCTGNCVSCPQSNHPFCDLFNMGLLGTVVNSSYGIKIQKFKTPYEDFSSGLRGDVEFFLIHPALREYINDLHNNTDIGCRYELYIGILIGADLQWTKEYTDLYYVNKLIDGYSDERKKEYFTSLLRDYQKIPLDPPRMPRKQVVPFYERRTDLALKKYFKTGVLKLPKPISIFISYAYDNEAHKENVESFVEMLRQMGFNAEMDSMLKMQYPDIDQLMIHGLKADKIIIILSPEYKRKADNSIGGVWKEFKMIADDLENNPQKYIFVCFEEFSLELKKKISPVRIGNRWVVDLKRGKIDNYNELISFIKEEKEYPFSNPNPNIVSVKQKKIKPF